MTTYAWVGRTRTGQIVKGERAAESTDALERRAASASRSSSRRSAPAARKEERYRRVPAAQPGDLHAPVLGHDRRRPAARAVPRAARARKSRTSGSPTAIDQVAHRRRGRLVAGRRDAEAAVRVRRALHQHDRRRRGRRYSRHRFSSACRRSSRSRPSSSSQVRSAMIYPIAVLSIAAIVVIVILVKVIPTFTALFEGLNAKLPLATRVVIWMSKKTDHRAAVHRRRASCSARTCSAGTTQTHGRAACASTRCCCGCRCSARSSGRSPSRGSAARCRR